MKKCWDNLSKITVTVMPPLKYFINDVYSKKQKVEMCKVGCPNDPISKDFVVVVIFCLVLFDFLIR